MADSSKPTKKPLGLSFDTSFFLSLLEKLIAETPKLQNRPPEFVPEEDLAAKHILAKLEPYRKENNGVLEVEHIHYVPKRGNIIVKYPAQDKDCKRTVAFVGSHMDVVHADPENWEKDPFTLIVEGDMLYGRGTTDCLGHCALLTHIFCALAEHKIPLDVNVYGVFIADEEVGSGQVGVEKLMESGKLDMLQHGPVIWLDCADKQPNIGSGGVVSWKLTAQGKMCHSGFPHKGVNAIELAADAVRFMQDKFYKKFPTHAREAEYGFPCSSSLKPTRTSMPESSLNQIPAQCVIEGDVRLIPFYHIKDAIQCMHDAIQHLQEEKFASLHQDAKVRGPHCSYYRSEDLHGELKLETGHWIQGIACKLDSPGFKALHQATTEVLGKCEPLADTGSLPLVADLQEKGFDVQTIGYGVEDAYHADNEFARISDFEQGFTVLLRVLELVSAKSFS